MGAYQMQVPLTLLGSELAQIFLRQMPKHVTRLVACIAFAAAAKPTSHMYEEQMHNISFNWGIPDAWTVPYMYTVPSSLGATTGCSDDLCFHVALQIQMQCVTNALRCPQSDWLRGII